MKVLPHTEVPKHHLCKAGKFEHSQLTLSGPIAELLGARLAANLKTFARKNRYSGTFARDSTVPIEIFTFSSCRFYKLILSKYV